MNAIMDFIKDIFMLTPEKGLVGLSGIKTKKLVKKSIVKSSKKSEPKLSDLMKKNYKKLKV